MVEISGHHRRLKTLRLSIAGASPLDDLVDGSPFGFAGIDIKSYFMKAYSVWAYFLDDPNLVASRPDKDNKHYFISAIILRRSSASADFNWISCASCSPASLFFFVRT